VRDWNFLSEEREVTIGVFEKALTRIRKHIFVAPFTTPEDHIANDFYHPFLYLLFLVLERDYITEYANVSQQWGKQLPKNMNDYIECIVKHYKIALTIFNIIKKDTHAIIEKKHEFGDGEQFGFLQDAERKWAFLIPTKEGILKFVNYKKCFTCWRWKKLERKKPGEEVIQSFEDHLLACRICICGHRYEEGSVHTAMCIKSNWRTKQVKGQCKTYRQTPDTNYMENGQYFADFETFSETKEVNKRKVGSKYHVYAAGLLTPKDAYADSTRIYAGENALDDFMNYLLKEGHGVLWFFNGSRFDCAFMVEWLVTHNIEIQAPMMNCSSAISFEFETERHRGSKICVKDLARFLQGSLDANCHAFKIAKNKAKSDFDHSLIQSWRDVMIYKKYYSEYLRLDVVSLREIYRKYAKVVYDCFRIHISNFLTTSHLSYGAFSSQIEPNIMIAVHVDDEENIRRSYRGGRVFCGRKCWLSNVFTKFCIQQEISQEEYDAVDDYLEYGDVNSLYPSVQVNRSYPVGNYKILQPDANLQQVYCNGINAQLATLKPLFHRSIVQVNVECPKNIMIAFLMTKNKEGGVQQDLHDKQEEWYTGPELWFAIQLGYKVTRIHTMYIWEQCLDIFTQFVTILYQKKAEAKEGPIYTTMKLMMNGLTGKFAQHHMKPGKQFHPIPPTELGGEIHLSGVSNVRMLVDEDHNPISLLSEPIVKEKEYSPFPIQLSSFILGYSKIHMATILLEADLIKEQKYALIYMDTDSFIMHRAAYDRIEAKRKGFELGQLKKEVDGKIIGIVVLAPKTYNYVYIDRKTRSIKSVMRCKGIPHDPKPYDLFKDYSLEETLRYKAELALLEFFTKEDGEIQRNVEFKQQGERFQRYVLIPNTKEMMSVKREHRNLAWLRQCKIQNKISFFNMLDMVQEKIKIECLFPVMQRKFIPKKSLDEMGVAADYFIRNVFTELWWNKGERCYASEQDELENKTAYPIGHEKLL
jgi:hypothetical protein